MAEPLTRDEVLGLLVRRLATVLARPEREIVPEAAFDEDLQADSLDLVEVIEGVEADLADRGIAVNLSEDELLALRTVGDAADRLHQHARGAP
jgi:acyl carrier protein